LGQRQTERQAGIQSLSPPRGWHERERAQCGEPLASNRRLRQTLGDMDHLWKSLAGALTKDDLFLRVTLFVFGLCALALGVAAVNWLMTSNASWGWLLAVGMMGGLFLLWGFIVLVSAFTPPSNRWSKLAEKCYPEPAALDDAAIFLFIVLMPAVALTLALRALGVRGYVT
jgi:hypothetical protein